MYRHVMVPLDDASLSLGTAGQAVALAHALGAQVTFFHAGPQGAGDMRAFFASAEALARQAGVACASLCVASDRPYEAILDAAQARRCDLVFMPSHGRRGVTGLALGSQTQKLLQHTTIPVLVSVGEGNVSGLEHRDALTVIRDEHRSLAVVMHGLEHLVRDSRERQAPPRFPLLRAMLYYIDAFPEKLHHPKEDGYLFRKLRQRTVEFDDTLDELERQHVAGRELVADLEQTLARYEAEPAEGFAGFAAAVDRFAAMQWQHMSIEQKVIVPAARRYLTAEDWLEIGRAFAENGDPRFSADTDEEFARVFGEILEIAPKRIFDGPDHGRL